MSNKKSTQNEKYNFGSVQHDSNLLLTLEHVLWQVRHHQSQKRRHVTTMCVHTLKDNYKNKVNELAFFTLQVDINEVSDLEFLQM